MRLLVSLTKPALFNILLPYSVSTLLNYDIQDEISGFFDL